MVCGRAYTTNAQTTSLERQGLLCAGAPASNRGQHDTAEWRAGESQNANLSGTECHSLAGSAYSFRNNDARRMLWWRESTGITLT
jgi:hypothetical protein